MTLKSLGCTSLCSVIDRLEIGIIVLDEAHQVLHWNRWMTGRSNQTPEQAIGQKLESIFPEISSNRLKLAINHAIKDGLPSLLSPALHSTLLALYQTEDDRRQNKRMQQMIHVLPLRDQASKSACLIQITDMAQRVAHRDKVDVIVRQGNSLGVGFNRLDIKLFAQFGEHAGRRIKSQQLAVRPNQALPFNRNQPGARGDIEQGHAGLQTITTQYIAPVPGTTAQRGQTFGAVVTRCCLIEHRLRDLPPLIFR